LHLQAGHGLQHVGEAVGIQPGDLVAGDDGDVFGDLGDGAGGATGGNGRLLLGDQIVQVQGVAALPPQAGAVRPKMAARIMSLNSARRGFINCKPKGKFNNNSNQL